MSRATHDETVDLLTKIVKQAPKDKEAEGNLRLFVREAAEHAPVHELARIGQAIIENLKDANKNHRRLP